MMKHSLELSSGLLLYHSPKKTGFEIFSGTFQGDFGKKCLDRIILRGEEVFVMGIHNEYYKRNV